MWFPTEGEQAGAIHQFARGAVRFGVIPEDRAFKSDHALDHFGQLANGNIAAEANVDELFIRIILHQEDAGAGHIVRVKKLAKGRAGAPTSDGWRAGDFRLMKLADKRRQNVGVLEIVIVVRPVKIGGHGADKIAAVLAAIGLTHFDAGDLGDGVPFIGRFERAGQEILFLQRLWRKFGINAGTAEEKKFFYAGLEGAMDEVVLDLQVLEKEFGGMAIVGEDATYLCRSHENVIWFFIGIEFLNGDGIQEVQLGVTAAKQVGKSPSSQFAPNSAAGEAAMAGNVDARVGLHLRGGR